MAKHFFLTFVLTCLGLVAWAQDDDTSWKYPGYEWTWSATNVGDNSYQGTTSEKSFYVTYSQVTLDVNMTTSARNELYVYYNDVQVLKVTKWGETDYSDHAWKNTYVIDNLEPGHFLKLVFVNKEPYMGGNANERCTVTGHVGKTHYKQYVTTTMSGQAFSHRDYKYLAVESEERNPTVARDGQGRAWYDPDYDDSQWAAIASDIFAPQSVCNAFFRWDFDMEHPTPGANYVLKVSEIEFAPKNYFYRNIWINGNPMSVTNADMCVELTIPGEYLNAGRNVIAIGISGFDANYNFRRLNASLYLREDNLSQAEQKREQSKFNQTVIADYPDLRAEGSACWTASQSAYGQMTDEQIAARMGFVRRLLEVRKEATDLLARMDAASPEATRLQATYDACVPAFSAGDQTLRQQIDDLRLAIAYASVDYFQADDPATTGNYALTLHDGKLAYWFYPDQKKVYLKVLSDYPYPVLNLPTTMRCNGDLFIVARVDVECGQKHIQTINYPAHVNSLLLGIIDQWKKVTIPAQVKTLLGLGDVNNWQERWPGLEEVELQGQNIHLVTFGLRGGVLRMPNMTTPPTSEYEIGERLSRTLVYIPEGTFHTYSINNTWHEQLLVEGEGKTLHTGTLAEGELGLIVVNDAGSLVEINHLVIDGGHLNSDDWQAIADMKNLISLDMSGTTVRNIPDRAFQDRWAIKDFRLPAQLETIGDEAFRNCLFTAIDLPATLTSIGGSAFEYCTKLQSIALPNGITAIGRSTFANCHNLRQATLSPNIQTLDESAFNSCDLRSIVLPDSLKSVSKWAFQYNRNLTSVTFNEGLTTIGESAFEQTALRSVTLPSTMVGLDKRVFSLCDSLRSVTLNEGLSYLYQGAFGGCKMLTEVVLPSTLIQCLNTPFNDCSGLVRLESRSVAPPFTDKSIPATGFDTERFIVSVPKWGLTDYKLANGWKDFLNFEASDVLPQQITLSQDFHLLLDEATLAVYHPDIVMVQSDFHIDGPDGQLLSAVGNLTVSSRSKLNANSLDMYIRPYGFRERTGFRGNSLIVNGEMRAEDVTLRMMMHSGRWDFFSVPFAVRVGDILPRDAKTVCVIRQHDAVAHANGDLAHGWRNLGPDDVLQVGKGYIFHGARPGEYWGDPGVMFSAKPLTTSPDRQALFRADDRTLPLVQQPSDFAHSSNWNFLGNPFPCYYDTRFMDVEAPITVWSGEVYEAYSLTDDAYILHPGEAFFIQAPLDVTQMTLAKEGRQTHPVARTLDGESSARRAAAATQRTLINLHLTHGDRADRTRVVVNPQASTDYESSRDASKMRSAEATAVQLYTLQGTTELAINERPLADGLVRLGMVCPEAGTFTVSLDQDVDVELTVVDHETGVRHSLTAGQPYTFQVTAAGDIQGRLELRLGAQQTAIESLHADDAAARTAPAYDLLGRRHMGQGHVVIGEGQKYIIK